MADNANRVIFKNRAKCHKQIAVNLTLILQNLDHPVRLQCAVSPLQWRWSKSQVFILNSQWNDLTTPLADFVLTSSFTKPNPEENNCFVQIIAKLVYKIKYTWLYRSSNIPVLLGQTVRNHTIAFVEDVLGRLAQVGVGGRHGHCIYR